MNFNKKSLWWRIIVLLCLLVAGCSQSVEQIPVVTSTPGQAIFTGLDPSETAQAYLGAWKAGDYAAMHALLTTNSQETISLEQLTDHYKGVAAEAALDALDYEILSSFTGSETAQVSFRPLLHSSLVGDFSAETRMNLSLEDGHWRVMWDDTLVLPQLMGANYLSMVRDGYAPARANIYDRYGQALVAQTDATAIGLYPDEIDPVQAEVLFAQLYELTGLSPETIQSLYASYPAGQGWYLPLGEAPASEIAARYELLSTLSGLSLQPYKARFYFDGGIATHLLGYMGTISEEEAETYQLQGYRLDERVGKSGLEKWGEPYLAGGRGGALFVMDAQGQPVTRLAEAASSPSQAIYTTLDKDFQNAVEQSIAGFRGAVVVLERDTGRVLAMVSSPDFNPNAFEPVNFNSEMLQAELNNPNQPLINRATQGLYPLGSVFKIITMAAAIESGEYSPDTQYYCGSVFEELAGATLYDWTHDYDLPPSGLLTLAQALVRSCNPYFYHVGLDLFNKGKTTTISSMATAFGLGQLTGIEGVAEEPGQVPEPQEPIDATNGAIGQGALLVTPLQVARFIGAIGNGGTLYRPQVVEKIVPPGGEPSFVFQPDAQGKLPLQAGTLQAIQEALVGVIRSADPRGTAYHVFTGLDVPVAGKTGTAQTGISAPHAWFAGYTFAEREDRPDIAVAVVVETAGEGSDYAAPIFRRIVEMYYQGVPGKLYDWETTYNVTRTPGPELLETATPEP
jgi:penicillin-binding protein 2